MNPIDLRARVRTRRFQLAAAGMAALASCALHAGTASASTNQIGLFADPLLQINPAGEVPQLNALGVSTVRVMLNWSSVAPSSRSTRAPRFSATNPGAYPAHNWAQWDNSIKTLSAAGIKVDLDIMGGPPRWAQPSGAPRNFYNGYFGWKVNAKDFGQFVQAVGTRYDGHYHGLPKVSIWSLWNEPNFGQQLGPQNIDATSKSNGYDVGAGYYRNLLRTGYAALHRINSHATILVGEIAGQGRTDHKTRSYPQGLPGNTAISSPIPWIETLYCLNSHNRPLTGTAGRDAACPTSSGARRSFVKDNPALFDASAISIHPYASTFPPNAPSRKVPSSFIILPVIGRLTTEMSQVTNAWHHHRNYPIWSTEYGFVTSPPQKDSPGRTYPSPLQAATFLNEAEYQSYRNRNLATYAQYLLTDPAYVKGNGLFTSGLLYSNGKPKPGYAAYRMPLWLPRQTVRKGTNTEIWGGARPVVFAAKLGSSARRVSIQMQSHGRWQTIHTVSVSATNGYFDTHVRMTSGGNLRLAYTYPSNELGLPLGDAGSTIYSRTVAVHVTG